MESPLGNSGRKATHDFLSLYSPSSAHVQQDPPPPPGGHLKTQDFLQPLERERKHEMLSSTREESRGGMASMEKPPVPVVPSASSIEQLLPGGIGTYSISYFNQRAEGSLFTSTAQACSTTRNDENSNCSSYTGSGFTLWDESAAKKGKTGKENITSHRHVLQEAGVNVSGVQWMSSSSHHRHNPATYSSFSSSQLSSSQNTQSLMDMITKNEQEEDDDDEEEDRFVIKKELSSHHKGNLSVKTESKTIDQKPSTPRSKHSATEQRRRSKINDRIQKLRDIIPNSDQKRDKASFLLEVIDYIHFLQEKVNKYESPHNLWSHESSKMAQLSNCQGVEGFFDHKQKQGGAKTELCSARLDKKKTSISPNLILTNGQTLMDSEHPETTPLHPTTSIFNFGRSSTITSQSQPKRSRTGNCTEAGQEMNGTINISSLYSQGLLNTLTKALHGSGVDVSRACISVQIDLGKRAYGVTLPKDEERPRPGGSNGEDFSRALKKLRSS